MTLSADLSLPLRQLCMKNRGKVNITRYRFRYHFKMIPDRVHLSYRLKEGLALHRSWCSSLAYHYFIRTRHFHGKR